MRYEDTGNLTLGWAEMVPAWAFARQAGTWKLHYHCGSERLGAGSRIRIYPPFTYDAQQCSMVRWTLGTLSVHYNGDTGVSIRCIDILKEKYPNTKFSDFWPTEIIEVMITSSVLVGGQSLVIVMGDQKNGGKPAVAQWLSGPEMPFITTVDATGNGGKFERIPNYPKINVFGGKPEHLVSIIPSTAKIGQEFSLRVRAEDAHSNISELYQSRLQIECGESIAGYPEGAITLPDNGRKTFSGFSLNKPGTHRLRISDDRFDSTSTPISTDFTKPGERIFWGDIHGHTELTDGVGSENRYYEFARDEACLDFSAISEHRGGDQWWTCILEAARKYYEPGKFVTLPGYEWGWKCGHACIYGIDSNIPVITQDRQEELFALIRAGRVLMIPHHTNDPLTDTFSCFTWDQFDHDLIQVAEICQMRGSFEKNWNGSHVLFGGYRHSVQDGLRQGFQVGFIGGTDTHVGRPGSPCYTAFCSGFRVPSSKSLRLDKFHLDSTRCGLTAVFASELTREAIFDALRRRRTYATTGARILLNFEVGNLRMGEQGKIRAPAKIKIRIGATAPLKSVTIVRNNEDAHSVPGKGLDQEVTWEDRDANSGCWYYVRVLQHDGHMAWASPVWCK